MSVGIRRERPRRRRWRQQKVDGRASVTSFDKDGVGMKKAARQEDQAKDQEP